MKIVIVGAGVAGLAIGWRLQQAGAQVTVLERTQAGMAATWAAAGMLAPGGESMSGAEADFGRWSSSLWPGFAKELEEMGGLSLGYVRSGALLVALDDAMAATLAQRAESDGGLEVLNAPQALEREPMLSPLISGALWAAEDAQVDNRVLGPALARAFVRAGGSLQLNEAAVRIEMFEGAAVGVRTAFALYEPDAIVIAAGAWSSRLAGLPPGAIPVVRPMKGEMIALAPPAGASMPRQIVHSGHAYLVPRRGRVLVGATVTDDGFNTTRTPQAADNLFASATALMPALADWSIDEHWAGLRPAAPDNLPVLGRTSVDQLFLASGQFRNGILYAPAVAELMKRIVLGEGAPAPYEAFDPRRF